MCQSVVQELSPPAILRFSSIYSLWIPEPSTVFSALPPRAVLGNVIIQQVFSGFLSSIQDNGNIYLAVPIRGGN